MQTARIGISQSLELGYSKQQKKKEKNICRHKNIKGKDGQQPFHYQMLPISFKEIYDAKYTWKNRNIYDIDQIKQLYFCEIMIIIQTNYQLDHRPNVDSRKKKITIINSPKLDEFFFYVK